MQPDEQQGQVLGLVQVLQVLRRRWRWIAGTVAVVTTLALGLSLQQDAKYVASTTVLLRTVADATILQTDPNAQVPFFAERQVQNALQVIQSSAMHTAVEKAYDGPLPVDSVTAAALTDGSDAVELKVSATDPEEAADLVNLYAVTYLQFSTDQRLDLLEAATAQIQVRITALDQQREEVAAPLTQVENRLAANPGNESLIQQKAALESQIGPQLDALDAQRAVYVKNQNDLALGIGLTPESTAQILTEATPPTEPVSPKPVRDGIVGIMVGLGLGFALALVREFLDESIRTSSDLELALKGRYPILGVIPQVDDGEAELQPDLGSQSPIAEAYRSLRTSVRFSELDRPMQIIQITSGSPGEGKTTTAANLAKVLAQAGHRIAVACCDLRRPRIHLHFGVPVSPGMADVVLGERTLNEALRSVGNNTFVLPAGTAPPNPSELLGTERAQRVMTALAQELDFVVVDTTPVLAVTDALVTSRFVDATIVVVSAHTTTRRQLMETLKLLEQSSAPIIGVVLNRAGAEEHNLYGYSYDARDYGLGPAGERPTAPLETRGPAPASR